VRYITNKFEKLYSKDPNYAVKWLKDELDKRPPKIKEMVITKLSWRYKL